MLAIPNGFIESVSKPEWVAAVALSIQAVILWLQARILLKHHATMKEHAGIAKAQATTAELIGKALEQLGKVLSDQAKVTEEQFRFHKKIEAQAARSAVYTMLLDVRTTVDLLIEVGSQNPRAADAERQVVVRLMNSALALQKSLLTNIHLTAKEKIYFTRYCADITPLVLNKSKYPDIVKFSNIQGKYSDFLDMLREVSQTPDSI
jgi:hypothetical protein